MNAIAPGMTRLTALFERVDHLSLRERALVFGAGMALVYVAWQLLLMDPLVKRVHASEQRLVEARARLDNAELAGSAATQDPAFLAAARNAALSGRLATLEAQLGAAARGYVSPTHVVELLRDLVAKQAGLHLVSLRNLPAESLAKPATDTATIGTVGAAGAAGAAGGPAGGNDADSGPYLHPVELVVEGDYLSVIDYLKTIESLPWRIHWQRLELRSGVYPSNRVRIVIGAFSLSKDWINV